MSFTSPVLTFVTVDSLVSPVKPEEVKHAITLPQEFASKKIKAYVHKLLAKNDKHAPA